MAVRLFTGDSIIEHMFSFTPSRPLREQIAASQIQFAGHVQEGLPFPLGATWDGLGVNFALFSAHATKVERLFDRDGRRELERMSCCRNIPTRSGTAICPMRGRGRCMVTASTGRSDDRRSPLQPEQTPARPLCQGAGRPYALVGRPFRYRIGSPRDDLSFDRRDSAPGMPKCRVVDPAFTWGNTQSPRIPWDRTIFYETHVGGYTMRHLTVPPQLQGTYAGLAHQDVVDYIRSIGITSVELLPIHAFLDDRHLLERDCGTSGATTASDLRARTALFRERDHRRVQGDGRPIPRCRDRGDPGRGL